MDADEFLISANGGNPRDILEKINLDKVYQIPWQTYVPYNTTQHEFIPSQLQYCRDSSYENFFKVIIPTNLIKNRNVLVSEGNHDVININSKEKLFNLKIAHYPIRSIEQIYSKICVGALNYLSSSSYKKGQAWHWFRLYNEIKVGRKCLDIVELSKYYDIQDKLSQDVVIHFNLIDLSFCDNIQLKYSNSNIDYLANILNNCENIISKYNKTSKDLIDLNLELSSKDELINDYKDEIEHLNKTIADKDLKINRYSGELNRLVNSKSWRFTSVFRLIFNKLRKIH